MQNYNGRKKFYYGKRDGKKQSLTKFDGQRLELVRALIANLIIDEEQEQAGIVSRLHEMGEFALSHEILPDSIKAERDVLKAIYRMAAEERPATRDAILQRVRLEHEDAETVVDNLLLNYRTTPPGVATTSFALHDWIERQNMIVGMREALKIVESDMYFSNDAYMEIMDIVTQIAPDRYTDTGMTGSEAMRDYRRRREIDEEIMLRGQRLAPTFPWDGLNKKITNWRAGEMMSILARSKHGKTSLAIMLAEYFAYGDLKKEIPEGDVPEDGFYDVAFFHLESETIDLHDRIVARHLGIPGEQMANVPILKGRNKKLAERFDVLDQRIAQAEKTRGILHYLYRPGINLTKLRGEVKELKAEADARGRELIVIIDYYGVMDWSDLANDSTRGYNELATRLKSDVADQIGVRILAFAQRNINAASTGKKTPFNGSMLIMRSQIVIQVERGEATTEMAVVGTDGKQVKDGLGNNMFAHKQGEPAGPSVLNVTFANRNPAGPVPVLFHNSYFNVLDNPGGPTKVETP